MEWTVEKIVEATGGRLLSGNPGAAVGEIATDTRTLDPGDAFLALIGERNDGHDFVPEAVARKVGAVIVQEDRLAAPFPADTAVIAVSDTLHALGEAARYWRNRFPIPVIGITGSNGKTSTKEMVAAILARERSVLKNKGNFNNLIGVPLTLLGLRPHHRMAVVEMGINVRGEMARLAEICRPTAALITNIQPAHLEGLQSLERVLEEKGKLWESLGPDDLMVVNCDDARLAAFAEKFGARRVTYSQGGFPADVRLAGEVRTIGMESVFDIEVGGAAQQIRLSVLGMHQVQNAVAAAAAAYGLGESPRAIALGLAAHRPVSQRMQVHELGDGTTLVDDTYNANPVSMSAAIRSVASVRGERPFVAILGEMRELGVESARLHREVGRQLGGAGVSALVTMGDLGREIAEGAREAGVPADVCHHARDHEDAVLWVRGRWAGSWILVKGSRGMAMERVVKGIIDNAR